MQQAEARTAAKAALKSLEFRYLLCANGLGSLAGRALVVVIGYQIYRLTRSPLALGWLGLVEALPAISLALFGGHVADRSDRRRIVLITQCVSVLCALSFALLSGSGHAAALYGLYLIVFVAGIARGFADPASAAFEAQVIPREFFVHASGWTSSVSLSCSIAGPVVGGLAYGLLGARYTYLLLAALYGLSLFFISQIRAKAIPLPESESIWESIAVGVRYVARSQVIVGSMALDLFAVLFGGAIAMLPIFASDILKVGAVGLGFLTAAPSVGALLAALWSTRWPPVRHAGRNLMVSVALFGVSIIVFALSRSFVVSLVALFLTGVFDGISMVIRKAILRLLSPENMRGRIASVSSIFIGASNEIGAFESGIAASLLGAVRSVWIGGVVTLIVVAATAIAAPNLRRLNLETHERPSEI